MAFKVKDKFRFDNGDYISLAPNYYYKNEGKDCEITYNECYLGKGKACEITIISIKNDDYNIEISPLTSINIEQIKYTHRNADYTTSWSPLSKRTYNVGESFRMDVDKAHFEKYVAESQIEQIGGGVVATAKKSPWPMILGGVAVIGLVWYFSRKK